MFTHAGGIVSHVPTLHANTTSVRTSAGSIKGTYTLGEYLVLLSNAGTIDVEVVVDTSVQSPKAKFKTQSQAGSTSVDLLPPLKHRDQIESSHVSQAGSVTLNYPGEWEGTVEAQIAAGSLKLSGEGLRIVESRGQLVDRYEKAVRGDFEKKGTVHIVNAAGSIVFSLEQ